MKLTLAALALLGFHTLASAQQAQSTITLNVPDLACSTHSGTHTFPVQSWTFSAANPPAAAGGAGTAAGRAQISALTINKTFDECSAGLFAAVTTGKHFNKVTLTQSDASGRQTEMTVQLGDVVVSNYQLGGGPGSVEPVESISLSFIQITIANPQNNSQAGWDSKANKPT